jgi:phosphatidylserine decarboxylase
MKSAMRAQYPHPLIAREGWAYVAGTAAAALAVAVLAGWWSIPLWLAAAFVLQFFRDPPRTLPRDARAVVAPADGRIVAVERARDPWLERDAIKVSIFMNVFNVHSNRSPVDAQVKQAWYSAGTFVNANLDKASLENERNALWLKRADGADFTCVQIAGLIARRIVCYAKPGDTLSRGQRFGFIRFGSRVDLYVPPGASVSAALGEKVYGGSSVLAIMEGNGQL